MASSLLAALPQVSEWSPPEEPPRTGVYGVAVQVGAQVSTAGGPESGLVRGEAMSAEVIQIFTQSPRQWRPYAISPEQFEAYRAAQASQQTVKATFSHATYLINLATPNEEIAEKSFHCLVENLASATRLGAAGVVLHVGSHLGRGVDAVIDHVAESLLHALDSAEQRVDGPLCTLLLENAAGTGGTIGRSFAELGALIAATGADTRLGTCLDTQHLFASGVSFETLEEADAVVADLDNEIGLDRLGLIHLNDSKVPLGANRDRHENLGEGLIGATALGSLLGHDALQSVPVVLEVPGSGDGPRATDLERARSILEDGVARRS